MNRLSACSIAVVCLSVISFGCTSPYYAHRGAALGGLTGAGVGAAIGNANGNTIAGTAIGSAVGAVAGATVGDAIDEENYHKEQRRIAQDSLTTPNDIVAMGNAGIGSDVIIQHVQTNGFAGPLDSADLIWMKQQGVEDDVLRAIQGSPQPTVAIPPPDPTPMVVEEHYYARPPFRPVHPRQYLASRFRPYRARIGHYRW